MAAVQPFPQPAVAGAPLTVGYVDASFDGGMGELLSQRGTLAVIGFGLDEISSTDPRALRIPLQPIGAVPPPLEIWRVDDGVASGRDNDLSWSCGGGYLMVAMRLDEAAHGGIKSASAYAYHRLLETLADHGHPHLLRAWNYLADINDGDGDEERYRHFTTGRADGMSGLACDSYPAATAIGRVDGVRELVVYALAATTRGRPVENPRQVSAYRYPRQYGPISPSFARAMRVDIPGPALLISGTASVVGHASLHDRADAQIAETLRNLDSLVETAGMGVSLPSSTWLKAYVRNPLDAGLIEEKLRQHGIATEHVVCLHGDICRVELLLEIDGIAVARD